MRMFERARTGGIYHSSQIAMTVLLWPLSAPVVESYQYIQFGGPHEQSPYLSTLVEIEMALLIQYHPKVTLSALCWSLSNIDCTMGITT
jgi:hypothetical protein